jgi:mutator protein MutT
VTAGLIWKEGRVLITKRLKGTHLGGFWEFPGGKQKSGESLNECLEREIEEEVGLKVRAAQAVLTVDHEYGAKVISLHFFNCISLPGEPRALQCQQVRWVDPAELGKFNFPPPDEKAIKYICGLGSGVRKER